MPFLSKKQSKNCHNSSQFCHIAQKTTLKFVTISCIYLLQSNTIYAIMKQH